MLQIEYSRANIIQLYNISFPRDLLQVITINGTSNAQHLNQELMFPICAVLVSLCEITHGHAPAHTDICTHTCATAYLQWLNFSLNSICWQLAVIHLTCITHTAC